MAAQNARTAPDFMSRSVIYQVWMRSFTPEGTLYATATHLQHIADLGATIIYISPLNVHGYPSVFGPSTPYEIKDYDVIDPEYGTEADLKALVAQAHKLGLKVIMDIVYAHSANDNVLLNKPGFYPAHSGRQAHHVALEDSDAGLQESAGARVFPQQHAALG